MNPMSPEIYKKLYPWHDTLHPSWCFGLNEGPFGVVITPPNSTRTSVVASKVVGIRLTQSNEIIFSIYGGSEISFLKGANDTTETRLMMRDQYEYLIGRGRKQSHSISKEIEKMFLHFEAEIQNKNSGPNRGMGSLTNHINVELVNFINNRCSLDLYCQLYVGREYLKEVNYFVDYTYSDRTGRVEWFALDRTAGNVFIDYLPSGVFKTTKRFK